MLLKKGKKRAPAAVSVTTSATLLSAANTTRLVISFYNNGSATAYLGNANTVTTSTGFPLPPGSSFEDSDSTDDWYAITSSGTADVRILEIRTVSI